MGGCHDEATCPQRPAGRQKFRSSLFKGLQVQGSALVAPAGAKGPRTTITQAGLVPKGTAPAGGTPPSPAGIPSGTCPTGNLPFRGRPAQEPPSTVGRRAASQPFGGTVCGLWPVFTRGAAPAGADLSVACGRHLPFQGRPAQEPPSAVGRGAASQPFGGTIYSKACGPCRSIRPSGRGPKTVAWW